MPGTTDIGNHGDDTVTTISLPFSYTLYDQIFTSINLSSNGNAQFTTTDTAFTNLCLPWTTHNYTIFPYWDDQRTLVHSSPAPRYFHLDQGHCARPYLQHRMAHALTSQGAALLNYELRLYEGQSRFDVIYGTVTNGNTSATAGVQKNDTAFDQYFCNGSGSACYRRAKLHPDAVRTSPTPTPTGSPPSPTPTASNIAYPDGSGYGYTYSYGYGYTYTNRKPKLHPELHIHIWHRNARAGNHRHWKPLR